MSILTALLLAAGCGPTPSSPNAVRVEPVTGMEFVRIEAGSFLMGTARDEPLREVQETRHPVTLTKAFFLGRSEVTQGQWEAILGENPSEFRECGPDCPVENVGYREIEAFIDALESATGERFRLPTEAEWEYACRAGTETTFGIGKRISSSEANFDGRTPYPGAEPGPFVSGTTPVGTYPPNPWGLYDMNGNVWEWCEDDHCPYPEGPVVDPLARCDSGLRVIRGGSWYYGPDSARCGLRYTHRPVDDGPSLGFRLVWETAETPPAVNRARP